MVGDEFMKETYDLVGANSKYPTKYNEVALVVDSYNQISKTLLDKFYFDVDEKNMTYDSFIGKEFKIIKNDDWYYQDNGLFKEKFADKKDELPAMYENGETLKITGIMRIKRGAPLVLYSPSVLYRKELTQKVVEDNMQSKMVKAQEREYLISTETKVEKSVLTGKPIDKTLLDWSGVPIFGDIFNRIPNSLNPLYLNKEERHEVYMQKIGASVMPKDIFIYPKTFDGKYEIKEHLDAYNQQQPKDKKVYYNDPSSLLTDTMGQIIDIISIVLVCFASVSLVVSSIMIGIITYVSVVERTKEIGVLRSIGARKVDIGNVFNAETAIIGLTAGVMGVALAGILTIPINVIIKHFAKGVITGNIAILSPVSAIILILISVTLTIIAGLIPSNIAAHKDPVQALRTE